LVIPMSSPRSPGFSASSQAFIPTFDRAKA
jgi:hypothetical protein